MNQTTTYNSVLTIAGSDSGGCAGIQADIKSISACGAYAASVITATTAQNTQGVFDIHPIPIPHLEKQLEAVFSDIHFGAIKIGMLHSSEVIETVAQKLSEYQAKNIVLDPVMVATSGDRLISDNALDALKQLLPQARLMTPNLDEAELLIGRAIPGDAIAACAKELGTAFKTSVLLKGGHLNEEAQEVVDTLYNYTTDTTTTIKNPRIPTKNTHGTGCSLSSSIAAFLSKGEDLEQAVQKACAYIHYAIDQGKNKVLGKGNGPINHFGL